MVNHFAVLVALGYCALTRSASLPHFTVQSPNKAFDIKVPVQLGVMSQCPDALLCETTFDRVLEHVDDKVDLSLVYVARIDPSQPDFGVWCMHGPKECAGNIQQLCVFKHAPFNKWWEFVQCQNYEGRYKIGEPDIAFKCAKIVGIDWNESGVGQCAGSDASGKAAEGIRLLQESAILGKQLGIEKSCTVLINQKPVCIHDGSWKSCENGHEVSDFVWQIEKEYERLNQ
ncbi:hypothetical protein CVT24_003997 [Panaeolus cyanescens]|uniref:Gamma interferon inducible lysosomal thiol reductase GILT n=1 Tax=Panaeolus cyanescens TaxID=181874 RepID=A0A409Y652_9AGAR|nr:hypothetical protein CVT24_003997 [Panaeolus cyanescens]